MNSGNEHDHRPSNGQLPLSLLNEGAQLLAPAQNHTVNQVPPPAQQPPLSSQNSAQIAAIQPPSQQTQPPQTEQSAPQALPQVASTIGPGQFTIHQNVPNRSTTTQSYRPLNVRDALSYLDQVKIQFYDQADVYNNFLDIMKDFKSQAIDTPGVIDRVSQLFKGHPNLIQGFNTFLPPGYRIECSLNPNDPNTIKVHTPNGTTTMKYDESWNNEQTEQNPTPPQLPTQSQLVNTSLPLPSAGQDGNSDQMNHAITYVNKIKTRFANQPDIYKQFLEILQTYQREQKPIGEVYEQVTILFANSPDLLDDFKQFLPDTTNANNNINTMHSIAATTAVADGSYSQLPPVGNFHQYNHMYEYDANQENDQLRYQQLQQPPFLPGQPTLRQPIRPLEDNGSRESYSYENNYNQEAHYSSLRSELMPGPPMAKNGGIPVNPTLVPGIPQPIPAAGLGKTSSVLEEINFFDKVKRVIGNKQTYNDFLKVLNLFSQDIIDKRILIERVEAFLGEQNQDLIDWFKIFVKYEDKPLHIEDITFKKHQLELSLCKAYGPSYRQLPKAETYMPCSGRDEMCWEVLNDEWVGHPTWASEDSGFIAHRKNQYEEILFRIEEERLEYDYNMEANLRTIQTLETIANRIANMTPEQKANFKLPPGLGHTSVTIYKKVIRKVYDKDRGFEVIDALHDNPAVAVPIVLKRLKQKDEEWRRAQREWNKVWREMEQSVFFKSLDHLGLTFKQADKKLLTAKQLVSEISTVKLEQQNKRLYPLTPKPQEQLNYKFEDVDILFDVLQLSHSYIFKSSNYSSGDREKLIQFLKFFISLFFGIPIEDIDTQLASRKVAADKSGNGEALESVQELALDNSKKRPREDDLLRSVLKKQSRSKNENDSTPSSDSEDQGTLDEVEKSTELWITTTGRKFSLKDNETSLDKRDVFNLFCNTTVYVFFRHLRTIYERLQEVRNMNDEVAAEIRSRTVPQFAKDLNLINHQLKDLNVEIDGTKNCYLQVLALAERLIEGDLEHQWFEEAVRQGYRNKAYKIYTIDKVVQAMVKHMHGIITDSKTSEMMFLFETDRKTPISTAKDQILYRMHVRSLMSNDENMFKIIYKPKETLVNIHFVSLDDLTLNEHKTAEEEYNYYITSYVMSHPTEGVSVSKINMPFSKEFIESIDEDQCNGYVDSNLKVSICENSYRLFFEADGHDEFTANTVYENPVETKPRPEKVSSLAHHLEDEDIGWKLLLKEGSNFEQYNVKFNKLLNEGVDAYNATHIQEPLDRGVEVEVEPPKEESTKTEPPKEEIKPTTTGSNPTIAQVVEPKIDIDATMVQENNDTTIQQDANDTTADDNTMNENTVNETLTEATSTEGKP